MVDANRHSTMRAVLCRAFGPAQSLEIAEIPRPEVVGDNEVRIDVRVAGLNFPDSLIIKGEYQVSPPMPFVPGFEFAGEIIELGKTVSGLSVGQRVMGLTSCGYGAFAEEVIARPADIMPIPASLDYARAIALCVAYGTAFHALVQRGRITEGETLVVLGAAGSVGLAAVELGKALGAKVIAVSRTRTRSELALEKGADFGIGYAEEDLRQRILEITGGRGADVCIDMLGGASFHAMSRAMNWDGRLLVVGFTSGEIPKLSVNLPMLKGYQIAGVWWGPFMARDPLTNAANFETMARMIDTGRINPHIGGRFTLAQVPDAIDAILSRETHGKLLVDVAENE